MSGLGAGPSDLPLAEMLRAARLRQSLSLQAVADRVNAEAATDGTAGVATNRKRVSSWESGEVPRPATLCWLSRALGLDLEQLSRAAQEQVTRRQALRGAALVGETLLLQDPGQLMALMRSVVPLDADPMASAPSVSRQLIDDLQAFADFYGQRWGRVAPRSLLPAVKSNLALLRGLMPGPTTAHLRRRLYVAAAETALLAGWLSRQLDNRGDAAGYWAFARALAREAEERPLLAHVLVATSSIYSAATDHPPTDQATSLSLLDEADAVAGTRCSLALRSWILARRAEERSAAGDASSSASDFDQAARLLDRVQVRTEGILGDWDGERLALWRAHCEIHSNPEPPAHALNEASDVLERALAGLNPSRLYDRSRATLELAEARLRQGEIKETCALLIESLTLAADAGLMNHVRRVRRVRHQLSPWHHRADVRHLDERLRLAPT
jgi:transcriptional regulator with XRE-family HTH domain